MLSEGPMSFSQMVDELGIPGSHLTYHLENLGEFINKTDDGRYKLSSVGESAVSIMKGAEEVPSATQTKKFSALPFKWKSLLVGLMVAAVVLASMTGIQYAFFNQLSNDYQVLKIDYELLKSQSQQLPWSSAERAMIIIRDVVQIDTTKYQTSLLSDTVENRTELGGMAEEVQKYSLKSDQSDVDLVLRFRGNHFSLFQLNLIQGIPPFAPIYIQPQPTSVMEAARNLIQRYGSSSADSYLQDMVTLLSTASETTSSEQTLGNIKLKTTIYTGNVELLFTYNAGGYPYSAKALRLLFENHVLKEMSDDWFLFKVSTALVTVSEQQALLIARNAAQNFTWTADGQTVSDFTILTEPSSVMFYPHPRLPVRLVLVPYWYITLYLDKEYPGGINCLTVGVWADTGEVANIQTLATRVNT
jgi:hypothetical protein